MSDNILSKFILLIFYLCIIILIPLFLDLLFKLTVRRNRKDKIIEMATDLAHRTGKSLVIFDGPHNGSVMLQSDAPKETFDGKITEIIHEMADNSCVIVVSETLEYVDNLQNTIDDLKRVSGNDLYVVAIEKNSPRVFWDYNIINIMDKPYYVPMENIQWIAPNQLQKKIQNLYRYVFKVLPYDTTIKFLQAA